MCRYRATDLATWGDVGKMGRGAPRLDYGTNGLTEEQWQDLMRSLIDDVDTPGDDESENSLLQEVAGKDHLAGARGGQRQYRRP